MKVKNMTSKSGNPVPNQFIIEDIENDEIYFQSYDKIIVRENNHSMMTYLDSTYWNYSKTTGKYRNQFLNETKKETEAKIKSGEYILCDLN